MYRTNGFCVRELDVSDFITCRNTDKVTSEIIDSYVQKEIQDHSIPKICNLVLKTKTLLDVQSFHVSQHLVNDVL